MNACTSRAPRFVHTDNTHMASVLIFIDGVAINEGTPDVRAGYGLHYDPSQRGISCSLENINGHVRTGNRAGLRAAVAALQVRFWPGEGFRRIVIGTDSDYVVTGACEWYSSWQQRGWRTSRGETVRNRDLWEMLFAEIEKWERMGIRVQFYLVKRELNTEADRCARRGAVSLGIPVLISALAELFSRMKEERNVSNEFVELIGISFPA
ncbi:hypothetical protein PAXINDRAFT_79637 [Paxillus involutus ATCC 200175]|uniref:ribonuclease H n=1 Tax=Paxillus involutus ATCC 200175 TaxID=664439 RepID=A0A0C9TFC0_PAXIN|nr:hypothetical protein PAXINDRAFT_79637 [Paxillus involutus ATCC 200175]